MRKGVNMVALRLFEHNEKAYHAAVWMMEQYGKAAIVHPTGTGKSYIAFKLIEDNPEKVVIWLSPSEYIFKTQLESLKRNDPDFPLANVHFYTYAKLMCCTEGQLAEIAGLQPSYIILDEFHRAGAECWGESTVALLRLCPDARLLGLTATNIRYLDNNRDMAEELFDSRVASDMTLGEAIVRGILPAPNYVTTVYQYQKDLARYQTRVDNLRSAGIQDVNQKYLDALRRALEQADGLDKVFAHHITNKSGKYIVFCANKEHMDEMISHVPEWFAKVNAEVAVYEAYSDDPGTDKAFADFKADESDRLKLLFCIDMLNEGVHVEGISGVILFRPTISPIIYKQQIGRALTAGDNSAPLILDVVNNFEGLCSIAGLQGEMQEAVHRLYANGEGDKIVTERFEVVEQVHDCRVLFEQLQASLSSSWDHYFSEASIYYAEHGDLNIPKRYTTPAGLSLGEWLTTQRRVRAGQIPGNLTELQIARLDSIGMVWGNRKEIAWQHGFEVAKKYHDTYGNLMVPGKYVDPDGESWRLTYDRIEGEVIFTGYEWVDEDKSYDVDGNLLQGLYAQAIFFSDNKTFDKDNGYNIGSSTATVYLADGTTETYAACTNPSGSDYATVPEGTYHAKVGKHKGAYTALRMEDTDGSGRIELGYENPAYTDGRTYAVGINIHKPGINNLTGMITKKRPISAGCLLVDINSWDRFIGHFEAEDQKNNTVSVTVSRSLSEPVNVNRLPAFNFILNGTRESFFSRIKNRKL